MAVSFDMRVSVPSDVLVSALGDESVILNLKSECYFGLDPTGTRMWELLTTSESIQAAYESLLREYEVQGEQLRRDLDELVEKLVAQGLLETTGG